jgi:hypothetical protein
VSSPAVAGWPLPYSVAGYSEKNLEIGGRASARETTDLHPDKVLCGYPPFFTASGFPPRVPSLPSAQ